MRDVGSRHLADSTHLPAPAPETQTLTHAPPPVAHRAPTDEASHTPQTSAPSTPPSPALPNPPRPQDIGAGKSRAATSPSTPVPASAMGVETLTKIAQILKIEELYKRDYFPFSPHIKAQSALHFLPQIAQQVGDAASFERLAHVVLHLEGRDDHPISRLLMLYRLSLCPTELREAISLFAPSIFRKLGSVLERVALLNVLQTHVRGHDVEDFCRLVMLFGDARTVYRGSIPLYHADSIEKLVTLTSNDTVTLQNTPALVNAMDVARLGPVLWPQLEQALQILRSVDGVLALPAGLGSWFLHNQHSADEWDRTAHRVAQTCLRLQFSTPERPRINPAQMGQRLFDLVEAFGGVASGPDEDPVPTYTPPPPIS